MSTSLSGKILLKTLWSQDSDGDLVFNAYCPIDPRTDERSVVGCAALMHAQILFYWAGQGADLSLTLTTADAYRTSTRHIDISGEENPAYDYGVFSDINEQLAVISADTTEDIAALCYACGVLIESDYTSSSTSATMTDDVYVRAGFDSFNLISSTSNPLFYTTTRSRFSSQTTISDAGWEVIQDNLLNGFVIAVASGTLSHALVMDGYNAEDGTYHLNFGWGSDNVKEYSSSDRCYTGTGWYTADELESFSIYSLGIDLYPDYDGTVFTVTDAREYGVGTLYRIVEQASGLQENATMDVSADLAEVSISLSTALPAVSHDLTVKNLYGDIRIQTANSGMPGKNGTAEASLSSDATLEIINFAADFAAINSSSSAIAVKGGEKLVIDSLNGVVAANTFSTSYALYSGESSDISLVNGGLFAGKYTVAASSGESAITNIFAAFKSFDTDGVSAFSAIESCATGYAVYSGNGDDCLSLSDASAILGCVTLAGGENSITVESGSYLHSYITASADSLSLYLILKECSSTPLISLVDLTVNSFGNSTVYYGIDALTSALADAISVDVSQAETGTYALFTGVTEDACAALVLDLGGDVRLSLAGTRAYGAYTLDFADECLLLSVDNSLHITVKSIDENTTALSWNASTIMTDLALNYTDSPDNKLFIRTASGNVELYAVQKSYEVSLKEADSSLWSEAAQVSGTLSENAAAVISNENAIADLFFVNVVDTWDAQYQARHLGSVNDWDGTNECVNLDGKNKIADTVTGSSDANILFLTDDANGDALFLDDVYTAFPDEEQSRIAQIDEIRAGAGDDVVDMTSQRFEYTGEGLTIRGGEGDDTIWANKEQNCLFGDGGNDRLVGASGNDTLVGGIGDDSMHGGGGDDIFCFCENWGNDTVEQLADGSVTLWFVSGSEDNWDQATMTYTDGDNSVKVAGVSEVTLNFGEDEGNRYATLVSAGCFMEESSDRIYETEQKGVLAMV